MTVLFLVLAVAASAAPVSRKPVVKEGMVIRTKQQDAELNHWIIGLQAENLKNGERADRAEASETEVRKALTEAMGRTGTLEKEVKVVTDDRNLQAGLKDQALDRVDQLKAENEKLKADIRKLKRIIAGAVALIALLVLAACRTWALFPPYGMIAMGVIPLLIFAAVWKLL